MAVTSFNLCEGRLLNSTIHSVFVLNFSKIKGAVLFVNVSNLFETASFFDGENVRRTDTNIATENALAVTGIGFL